MGWYVNLHAICATPEIAYIPVPGLGFLFDLVFYRFAVSVIEADTLFTGRTFQFPTAFCCRFYWQLKSGFHSFSSFHVPAFTGWAVC
jgi:hypothetical protein